MLGDDGSVVSHSPIVRQGLLERRLRKIVDNPHSAREVRDALVKGGEFTVWICRDCPEQELMGIEVPS